MAYRVFFCCSSRQNVAAQEQYYVRSELILYIYRYDMT